MRPYVSEKVTFAIRYHQALRFYPDPSVGYEYPALYYLVFGKDYVPPPHIDAAYKFCRNHKWYMEARLVTVNDLYAFDPNVVVTLDSFLDIIGRHFRQPKEGLGARQQPRGAYVAHHRRPGCAALAGEPIDPGARPAGLPPLLLQSVPARRSYTSSPTPAG